MADLQSGLVSDKAFIEESSVRPNGDVVHTLYQRGRFLGKGGFAKVYEFIRTDTNKSSAAKLIPKASLTKPRARLKLMNEVKIHRSLVHENIVAFEHSFEDSENFYILLELCQNQTLSELVKRRKRLTPIEIQCILYQVVSGLKYIHANKVIHRDIKLGNIFLTEHMQIKVGDFGLAAKLEFNGEKKRTICGTPNYIAPEILEGKDGHSYEVDVWSIGVLAYTLAVGKAPFHSADVKNTYRRIKQGSYSFPSSVELPESLIDLISHILVNDVVLRPTLSEILAHPFFTETPFPKQLPCSTLAVPPSPSFLRAYQKSGFHSPRENMIMLSNQTPTRESHGDRPRVVHAQLSPRVLSPPRSPTGGRKKVSNSNYHPIHSNGPAVWVSKWIDYSTKYGIGYMLSNKNVGVYFNDATKMLSVGNTLLYQHRVGPQRQEEVKEFQLENHPKELSKKVNLLKYFTSHLGCTLGNWAPEPVFLKKWVTMPHCTIFRLSDKTVQVCFNDRTELLLCNPTRHIMYVDKVGRVTAHESKYVNDTGTGEMLRRLKYTKEALKHFLSTPTHVVSPRS